MRKRFLIALFDFVPLDARYNPSNGQKLYLGTDLGVFVSVDGGNNWLVENNFQLPNVIVDSLVFNTSGTIQLFAFTHGCAAWKVTPQ